MESRGEIVAAADVGLFVREDGFELGRRETFYDALGKEQDGTEETDDAGFQQSWRATYGQRGRSS
jgi:hypothetical protein